MREKFPLHRAGERVKGAILFRKREYPPYTPKRKDEGPSPSTPHIGSLDFEELLSLRNRVSAVFCCDTIWLAPIIRCRSAHLVEVQPNFCLLWICTILLMPAKAALLRSPHFNRKNDRVSGRFRSFYQFVPEDNRR